MHDHVLRIYISLGTILVNVLKGKIFFFLTSMDECLRTSQSCKRLVDIKVLFFENELFFNDVEDYFCQRTYIKLIQEIYLMYVCYQITSISCHVPRTNIELVFSIVVYHRFIYISLLFLAYISIEITDNKANIHWKAD